MPMRLHASRFLPAAKHQAATASRSWATMNGSSSSTIGYRMERRAGCALCARFSPHPGVCPKKVNDLALGALWPPLHRDD